jgi:hypothetical protein
MADEISVTIKATVVNGEFRDQFTPGNKRYDQDTGGRVARTTSLTTNSTALDVGELSSSKGWCFLTNQSTASEVVIGPTSASPFIRLFTACSAAVPLVAGTTLMARTLSGTATLDHMIWST